MVRSTEKALSKKECNTGVRVPENLFYEMVDLLKQPCSLNPAEGKCVLRLDKRNQVLDRLLLIRREIVMAPGDRPRTSKDLLF